MLFRSPLAKYFANRALTLIQNLSTGMNLSEWHTGFRAYTKKVLNTIPWERNSDDFVFDSQMLMQCVAFGFRIADIPVPIRYHETASSINMRRSVTYGLQTLGVLGQLMLHRAMMIRSPLFLPRNSASTSD